MHNFGPAGGAVGTSLGFTLKEIKELLALSAQRDVGRVKRSAQAKLNDVKSRIAGLPRRHRAHEFDDSHNLFGLTVGVCWR
jgi:DNA-binding transcriptional MerR regulator